MTQREIIILCAARDFNLPIEKLATHIQEKNLLQAKLFLMKYFGFKLPLTFVIAPGKPPIAPDLVGIIKNLTPDNLKEVENHHFNRPYNKIIVLINDLLKYKTSTRITDTQWYEEIASCAAKTSEKTPLERLKRCIDDKPIVNQKLILDLLSNIKYELNLTASLPVIIKTVQFYDKYDIVPTVKTGLLLETGDVLDLQTKEYLPEKDYTLIEERIDVK